MHDELTEVDIKKMQEEIDQRMALRHKLIQDVQEARSHGDLSENFEYRTAKRELGRNNSRIRYLQQMIDTAVVIKVKEVADAVCLFDHVTIFIPEDEEEKTIQLVTTLRQDALSGFVSKESPLGKALLGHKVGETVTVHVNADYSYDVEIRAIQKGVDNEDLPISSF